MSINKVRSDGSDGFHKRSNCRSKQHTCFSVLFSENISDEKWKYRNRFIFEQITIKSDFLDPRVLRWTERISIKKTQDLIIQLQIRWALCQLTVHIHGALRDGTHQWTTTKQLFLVVYRKSGAVGSRLTGAGWGGCAVSMVPCEKVESFLQAVREAYFLPDSRRAAMEKQSLFVSKPAGGAAIFLEDWNIWFCPDINQSKINICRNSKGFC